ncbi:MAG: RNA methyltransferase [Methylococcales bacterium]|nr:RNA methyltransferase [Methylococcales bacterium]
MLSNIRIVLVETSHPGNIGGVARAMKNMGLSQLYLVSPKIFPSSDATARAAGADDLLAKAVVCESLAEAIQDCSVVFGASARSRTISWPEITPRACVQIVQSLRPNTSVAIVFGRENSGLKNHELDVCQYLLRIPCNAAFSSLNLAAAVQVVGYEFFLAFGEQATPSIGDAGVNPLATAEQMESFYAHLRETIADIGFLHPDKSKSIMRRLRRIFNRIHLDTKELDILRGILRFSQNHNK